MAQRLGFLGTGQMAKALAAGFVRAGLAATADLLGSDVFAPAREAFEKETGGRTLHTNREVVQQSDVLILAVKPQMMEGLLTEIAGVVGAQHLVISIAAGVSIGKIRAALGESARIVRVMPNTPCLVGASASGYALGGAATEEDAAYVQKMLESVGVAVRVPEHLLDAVTGLSGSGPAYVYQIIEALSDGGVQAGLPRAIATTLAAQTLLGGAQMVLTTGKHPGELKDMVTSPGGTTIAGLAVLERAGVRGALMDAVVAATNRSKELGKE